MRRAVLLDDVLPDASRGGLFVTTNSEYLGGGRGVRLLAAARILVRASSLNQQRARLQKRSACVRRTSAVRSTPRRFHRQLSVRLRWRRLWHDLTDDARRVGVGGVSVLLARGVHALRVAGQRVGGGRRGGVRFRPAGRHVCVLGPIGAPTSVSSSFTTVAALVTAFRHPIPQ